MRRSRYPRESESSGQARSSALMTAHDRRRLSLHTEDYPKLLSGSEKSLKKLSHAASCRDGFAVITVSGFLRTR
jgi:hypothetical protein